MRLHINKEVHIMAVSTYITAPRGSYFTPLTTWYHTQRERFALRLAYRRTLRELSALSAHQLNDLGLSRSSLRQTAYHSTYN